MKLVLDMNFSPDWCPVLEKQGWDAVHWSTVGDPRATDSEIMHWAATNGLGRLVTWTQRGNQAMQTLNRRLGYVDRTIVLTMQGPLP